jgi:hypothetical protein
MNACNQSFSTATGDVDNGLAVAPQYIREDLALQYFGQDLHKHSAFISFAPLLNTAEVRAPLLDKLAAQYNGYRLSLLDRGGELFPVYAHQVLGQHPGHLLKVAGLSDWAPLLLGLGPVLHLISSHLKREDQLAKDQGQQGLGVVAKFVADNPTFLSLVTVGAGLRSAMSAGSSMLSALGGVANVLR